MAKEHGQLIALRLPQERDRELRQWARSEGISKSELIRRAIEEYLIQDRQIMTGDKGPGIKSMSEARTGEKSSP